MRSIKIKCGILISGLLMVELILASILFLTFSQNCLKHNSKIK